MSHLIIEVIYNTESRQVFTVQNIIRSFATPQGMTLADFVVEQALQVTPLMRSDTGRPDYAYRAGPPNHAMICFDLTYENPSHLPDNVEWTKLRWRCHDYGILGQNESHSLKWHEQDTLEAYIRERVSDVESEMITRILQREAA